MLTTRERGLAVFLGTTRKRERPLVDYIGRVEVLGPAACSLLSGFPRSISSPLSSRLVVCVYTDDAPHTATPFLATDSVKSPTTATYSDIR